MHLEWISSFDEEICLTKYLIIFIWLVLLQNVSEKKLIGEGNYFFNLQINRED